MKRTHLIHLAALMLLAAGCNLNQIPEVIPATETPTETPVPPTATIVPTPTIAPEIILSQGDSYLRNGYFADAAVTYKTLVEQSGAAPTDGAAAAYGMGQAAVREGLYSEAVAALTTFIDAHGQDERIAQARYLRGDAYLGLSRWSDAIADFEAYLALRPGLIDSYAYERIGDAQIALGQTDAALASYGRAASASRGADALLTLRERVAQVNASAARTAEAVAQYDAILSASQDAAYRAKIAFLAAQTVLESGDTQGGLVRMNQVFGSFPAQPEAYRAMSILLQNGVQLEPMARGIVNFNFGDYPAALEAFNDFTEAHINVGDIPARVYLLLGRTYREIGSSDAALTAFQTIIDQYPTDTLFGAALLEQGNTRFLQGDYSAAIELYMQMVDLYYYLPEAPEALWRAGYIYSIEGQAEQARAVFERLADNYPQSSQMRDGLFLAASSAYNAGLFDVAERYYAELSVKTSGEQQATAYYWVGRLALRRGDQRTASQAFALATQAAPDSYFAARAADVVNGIEPFTSTQQVNFQFDDAGDAAAAEDWLRETFGITQEGSLAQLSPELASDSHLVRGRELWDVAEYPEAFSEFETLIVMNQADPLACYQLAVFFREIGAYSSSITAAAYVIRNAQVSTLEAPAYLARMRFPVYYLDVVQEVSEQFEIDPLLVLVLIRQESLFNTYADGSAGGKGLMQLTSGTGDYIASELGWTDYYAADLYRPYTGIEFGAYSLSLQLQRFGGSTAAALAAYNADAGRAQRWLDLSGGDPDQLMTAIDADDTRLYVQNLYNNYNIYRTLYGG